MNDEFEVEVDLNAETEVKPKGKKTTKPAVSAKKQAMLDAIMAATEEELDEPMGAVRIDEKTRKIRIIIDEMAGCKDNYEAVGVNGVVYQIKRGVPVEVPPEVVHVLELAKATHIEQKQNPATGELEEVKRSFSAIPWRRA